MKLPRDASGYDVVKALKRLGFEQVGQTGSHIQLVKGPRHVTVPNHNVVAPGTLRSILRQAAIDLQTFVANLR